MQNDIKYGIIGYGWIVNKAHIPAIESNNAIVVAVYDTNQKQTDLIRQSLIHVTVYDKIEDFLRADMDVVLITTPNATHYSYTKLCLQNNKHVLCEKPVTLRSEEAMELSNLAYEKGLIYIQGCAYRFRKDIYELFKWIKEKDFGEILKIDCGWIRNKGVPSTGSWFTNKEISGGGCLIDIGTHVLDSALLFLGKSISPKFELELESINSNDIENGNAIWHEGTDKHKFEIDVEKTAKGCLTFEDGKKINIFISWNSECKGDCTFFNLHYKNATVKIRTLYGFSKSKMFEDSVIAVQEGDHYETYQYNDKDYSKLAFNRLHKYFMECVNKNEYVDGYSTNEDVVRTVRYIEGLYKNIVENLSNDFEIIELLKI